MKKLKILCPFCNAVWTAKMIGDLEDTCREDSYGNVDYGEPRGKIEIICEHCKKVVYVKEINN